MTEKRFIKNIPVAERQVLVDLVEYAQGSVISRTLAQNPAMNLTLFAFDAGEGLSTHTAPGDALAYVLDGEASITIAQQTYTIATGEALVMPADVPHAVQAEQRFKMLLVVVKGTGTEQAAQG